MTKKCLGCGALLQTDNPKKIGYINSDQYEKSDVCERCFRIKNYNEYQVAIKDEKEIIDSLKNINQTQDLVVLVLDVLNLPKDLSIIKENIANDILVVLTKRDLLPRSIKDDKLLEYIDNYKIKYIDKLVISSNKNYQFDLLFESIMKYKKSNDVYIVGFTNAGKSTMINKFMYNYAKTPGMITTSMLPSTTIENIVIKINDDLTIIDTPGILKDNSIVNYIDFNILKKLSSKKEIRPITYQIKTKQIFYIEDILRIDCFTNNNLTFYMSNDLTINRIYKEDSKSTNLKKHILQVPANSDIVITDLGFIKVQSATTIELYTIDKVEVFIRKALV